MHNLVRDITELSGTQSFSSPVLKFIPKSFRSKIGFFRYNQLPPIKEEEGNVSESEIELRNISLCSEYLNNNYRKKCFELKKAVSNDENGRKKLIEDTRPKDEKPLRKLPPSVNVNCLMNMNVKQQKPIWDTTFGKRLIYGRAASLETMSLPKIIKTKKNDKKNQCSKSANSSRFSFSGKNTYLAVGSNIAKTKKKKTEPARLQKKHRKVGEQKKIKEEETSEINTKHVLCKPKLQNKTSIETPLAGDLSFSKFLTDSLTTSRTSRNQNLLSECVKNILNGTTSHYNCENCGQIFSNVEELNGHKKKHDSEKQACVLCNKVYFKPNEFYRHLLTHESVDKLSCKKCKKYFPSVKKYKAHCKNAHSMNSKPDEPKNKNSLEGVEKPTSKYECKRCQLELDSEENFRAHKRNHIRLDLIGAYLLSSKSI